MLICVFYAVLIPKDTKKYCALHILYRPGPWVRGTAQEGHCRAEPHSPGASNSGATITEAGAGTDADSGPHELGVLSGGKNGVGEEFLVNSRQWRTGRQSQRQEILGSISETPSNLTSLQSIRSENGENNEASNTEGRVLWRWQFSLQSEAVTAIWKQTKPSRTSRERSGDIVLQSHVCSCGWLVWRTNM